LYWPIVKKSWPMKADAKPEERFSGEHRSDRFRFAFDYLGQQGQDGSGADGRRWILTPRRRGKNWLFFASFIRDGIETFGCLLPGAPRALARKSMIPRNVGQGLFNHLFGLMDLAAPRPTGIISPAALQTPGKGALSQ